MKHLLYTILYGWVILYTLWLFLSTLRANKWRSEFWRWTQFGLFGTVVVSVGLILKV